jgi:manganese/zinc/iron transport system substrate-binding protein
MRLGSIFFISISILLIGCVKKEKSFSKDGHKKHIVATTSMVADWVKNVSGDQIEVTALMGPGVDPHLYKPTAEDVVKLQNADLIFYSGLFLEGKMGDLFERLSQDGKNVFAITDSIPREKLLKPEQFKGHYDPHVWFDPQLWALCSDTVIKGLSTLDPSQKEAYEKRAEVYKQEILDMNVVARNWFRKVPVQKRVLITSHDAFNYLGRAYEIKVLGVQGISTVSEAGLADMIQIVDFIKKNQIKAIFVETSVPHANIQRISEDSGANIGGELFSDSLGIPGKTFQFEEKKYDEGTYVGTFLKNVKTIVEAL